MPEACSGWVESLASWLVVMGAFAGTLGASRTFREYTGSWFQRLWHWLTSIWRAGIARLKGWWGAAKSAVGRARARIVSLVNWVLVRIGLKQQATIVELRAAVSVASAGRATVTVAPGSIDSRVGALERWREGQTTQAAVQARWMGAGFFLIVVGELIRILAC